ncbi:MAG: hypothetical protein JOZ78_08450 [Chroococcidiopsidaceae cyanobacterium CP_BM_ER_R8_30]|nr:hypothetical protein [Chroococcidiopsidaceae cyanobacterium CP_BM_ER_R8_30]
MKRLNLSKLLGAGLIALSLTLLPSLPPTAQTTNSPSTSEFKADHNHRDATRPNSTAIEPNKKQVDWSLMGIVLLVGLLFLVANNFKRDSF